MEREKVVLTLTYDGGGFHGWQRQKGLVTVQGEVEKALEKIYGEPISLAASGRTDVGVHALGQVAHYVSPKDYPIESILNALNFYMPEMVRIVNVEKRSNFHARFTAKNKTYLYKAYASPVLDPFKIGRYLMLKEMPNLAAMERAIALFVGTHDFASFYALGSSAKTTTRTVFSASVSVCGNEIFLRVSANGFLYKMMRMIASAVIGAGQGKLSETEITEALQGKRVLSKLSAPSDGLYLEGVEYSCE